MVICMPHTGLRVMRIKPLATPIFLSTDATSILVRPSRTDDVLARQVAVRTQLINTH